MTVIEDPPPQYINAILKRYEKVAKAAPMLATLAVLALGQAAHAAMPSPQIMCTPFGCIWVCCYVGSVKICIL